MEDYHFKLPKEKMIWLTDKTNRTFSQTDMLYLLLNENFELLKQLEMKLKNCFVFYCPSSKEEVESVMNMNDKTNLLSL